MDFTYTPRMAELKARAADLAGKIMVFEDECEQHNGLSAESHATIRAAVLDAGLNAINHPTEWGGAGLTLLEQAVVQEELGKLTGALWDTVWRPANALRACTPEQRERWLLPGIRGERRDAVAITESSAGSDPSRIRTTATRDGDGYVIDGEKWFVTVGDVADHFLVLAMVEPEHAAHDVPRRQGHARRRAAAHAPLHAHVRLRAPRVRVPRRRGRPGVRAG